VSYHYVLKTLADTTFGQPVTPTGTSASITNLAPGTAYVFEVTAHGPNAVGDPVQCSGSTRKYIEQMSINAVSVMARKRVVSRGY